jgi:hypothetical protein
MLVSNLYLLRNVLAGAGILIGSMGLPQTALAQVSDVEGQVPDEFDTELFPDTIDDELGMSDAPPSLSDLASGPIIIRFANGKYA